MFCAPSLNGGAFELGGGTFEAGEGRAHDDIDVVLLADFGDDIGHKGHAVGGGLVHLPITGDEFFAEGHGV